MERVKLNDNGLKKLLEYLEGQYPGISESLNIKDGKLSIAETSIELTASVIPEAVVGIPEPTVSDPSADMPVTQNSMTVGKAPNSQVKQVGRAGVKRQQEEQTEQMAEKLKQYFPEKDQIQQAFANIAQSLKSSM
jgi:hypothetical protein